MAKKNEKPGKKSVKKAVAEALEAQEKQLAKAKKKAKAEAERVKAASAKERKKVKAEAAKLKEKAKARTQKQLEKAKAEAKKSKAAAKKVVEQSPPPTPTEIAPVVAASVDTVASMAADKLPDAWTVAVLRAKARDQGVTGYSRLTKAQLIERLGL